MRLRPLRDFAPEGQADVRLAVTQRDLDQLCAIDGFRNEQFNEVAVRLGDLPLCILLTEEAIEDFRYHDTKRNAQYGGKLEFIRGECRETESNAQRNRIGQDQEREPPEG